MGAILLVACVVQSCASKHPVRNDFGVARCPAGADEDPLSVNALQCWFAAPRDRWRIVSHESHYAVLVVQVEARNVRDADDIARRFVARERETFSEILVYVRPEDADAGRTRRVRWTRDNGLETMDFRTRPERDTASQKP